MKSSKTTLQLEDLHNIGSALADLLRHAGIHTPDELIAAGAIPAFIRIKANDPEVCFSKLCAIAGAIEGIRWHSLPEAKKAELRDFFMKAKK